MKRKRKIVYSVTLHEETAEWFRTLTPERKLSPGLAHAQALLSLPGVLKVAIAAYEAEEKERNERLKVSHQRSAPRGRGAVTPPASTKTDSVPRTALPVLPGGVIPPSVVLPTDNPFDDDSSGPQGEPGTTKGPEGDPRNPAQPSHAGSAPPDPGPMTDQERAEIAALEDGVSGLSPGPTAPAQEPEPERDPSADIAEPRF